MWRTSLHGHGRLVKGRKLTSSEGLRQLGTISAWIRNQHGFININVKKHHLFKSSIQPSIVGLRVGPSSESFQWFSTTTRSTNSKFLTSHIVGLGKMNDWQGILQTYEAEGHKFNMINYATAMNQLSRIGSLDRQDVRLNSLVSDIAEKLPDAQSWDVRAQVNILHAIAKMRLNSKSSKSIVDFILNRMDNAKRNTKENVATDSIINGNSQTISNSAWACAILGVECHGLFEAINERAAFLVEHGSPQTIANTVWACATLGVQCPAFFQSVDAHAASYLVENGLVQAISNTVWAFATLGVQCPNLCHAINEQASKVVMHGLPQNIANVGWALASLGADCPLLFQAINDNASKVIAKGTSQAISNTAWAFATMNIDGADLFPAIDSKAFYLLSRGKPQEIANTIWAFATLRKPCPNLCKAIDSRSSYLVSTATSQNIANIIWSFATLGVECPSFCKAIDDNASRLFADSSSQTIANTIWAFAILGYDCPGLFYAIQDRSEYLVDKCNEQEITNLCYSMAILNLVHMHESLFRALWKRAMQIQWDSVKNEGRIQLLQAFLMVSKEMDLEPPKEWITSSVPWMVDTKESLAQKEMSELLVDLGIAHEVEACPLESEDIVVPGLLAIDAACRGQWLAIEFDGPSHFLRRVGTTYMPEIEKGPTKAKRRFLEGLGWTVVNIRYFEWAKAETREARKALILEKLIAAGYREEGINDVTRPLDTDNSISL